VQEKTRHTLRLSELNKSIKSAVSDSFPSSLWVIGEISELKVNHAGHCYLELIEKDEKTDTINARARAVIWSSKYGMLRSYFETTTSYRLEKGIKILVLVRVEFHELYGLSLNISDIDPSYTLGDQEKKRLEIIRMLKEDGVFTMNKELPFPLVPQTIAVISSGTAAGYRDFQDQIDNNPYGYRFSCVLFQSVMQGQQAESSMISSLERIFSFEHLFDTVVIIRGGGSKADLACFDSYELASHIAQFSLPVLTGIGHEQDESIADMVAYQQLKTPTAVAEFLIDRVLAFETMLAGLQEKFILATTNILLGEQSKISRLEQELLVGLQNKINTIATEITTLSSALKFSLRNYFNLKQAALVTLEEISKRLDPQNVLKMGYSITSFKDKVLKDATQVSSGDEIKTVLNKGELRSTVQ
jgi:exodeoxyribonuclease VII large subunit